MASTSTSGISFSGLSSGLDTDSIVSALTRAESTRKTELQTKQNSLKTRQAAYATVKAGLSSVSQAAGALNTASTYSTIKTAVGDDAVASLTTTSSTAVGNYDLVVTALAKAEKISSAPQADTGSALNKTGVASVNGKAFKIEASDSLTSIAQKVNGLGSGVTASVVDGGAGRAYLTLSSSTTGVANAVSANDMSGTTLADLGLIGPGSTVRQTAGAAAVGNAFASQSDPLATVLGATGLAASTISIGGTAISVDPGTDTLESLASKINTAGISGVTATVQAGTKDGSTVYSLQISGASRPPAMADGGGVLGALGILRQTPANELVAAQDAAYTLDGVALTSPTNTVTGAIPGATLTLKKVDETSLTLTKDTTAVTKGVGNLVSSVNALFSTISQYSSFDTSSYATGVLFGDSVAEQAKNSVRSLLFSDTPGATGAVKNLASIGVGLDTSGNVTFDDVAFQAALDKDPVGVGSLLQSVGSGSSASLKYVSATTTAKASSTTNPYAVSVTQVATQASFVAGTASTGTRATAEKLTFTGSGFGTSGIAVDLEAGTNLATTVAKINADGRLKDLVSASVQGGKLRIDAKRYGASGNFTLTSNYSSSTSNSGVGVGGEGTAVLGLDVAGTIAGEAATGNGQFLTGTTGNAHTAGLQIQYTGLTTGAVGTIAYSRGAASRMTDLVSTLTDATNGLFTAADTSLQTQIDGLDKDMATLDDSLAAKTSELKARFASMEDAISKLKSQSSTVASMLGTTG